jgi:hypothetical protein
MAIETSYQTIRKESQSQTIVNQAVYARTLTQRVVGLLGRNQLPREEALIFKHCRSIHMWGMRFAIDVVFLDASDVVVKVFPSLKPWSCPPFVMRASTVIEMAEGIIEEHRIAPGDQLIICPTLN